MVSPRWRKVYRDLWLHRARSVLVVLAIAVGLAGAGTILSTWALVERATREGFLASRPASATIRTDSVDAVLLAAIRAVPEVALAEARRTVTASVRAQGTWRTAILFTADDLPAVEVGRLQLEAGAWPTGEAAMAIEQSSVAFAGLAVGEPVSLAIGDGSPEEIAVVGIVRDVGLAPGWMEHIVYGFVPRSMLARLGLSSTLDEVRLVVRDRAADRESVRRIAYRVKAVVEATGRTVRDVTVPEPGEHVHAGQMNSLLMTQGAFGALALALCGFLVVNLIAAMLAGEARQIGVMKAIGGQTEQLAAMYLGFALVLGAVATLIGLPIALVVGRIYAGLKAELLNFEVGGYAIPWPAIAIQVAVGCLLPVAAAAIPVWRASRRSAAESIRDFGIDGRGGPDASWVNRVTGPSRPVLLSLRNAFRRRTRMALTLTTLALGGAVFLGSVNLKASIHQSVDLLFGRQPFDLVVRVGAPLGADRLEAIVGRVAGVGAVEGWRSARAARVPGDGTLGESFVISGVPVPSRLVRYQPSEGRWLEPGDRRALVVSRSLQKTDPALQVGASVSLQVAGRGEPWTVVGVVEAGPSPSSYAPRDALGDDGAPPLASTAVVATDLEGLGAQVDLIQRIRAELSVAGVAVGGSQRMAESRRVVEDHLLMVADFLAVMGWLMIGVGGMGLASTMSLSVLERTREIGVLKAIGARHGAIARLVEIEGLVIGLASWLLALPLSIPMSVVLAKAFSRVMIEVPTNYLPVAGGALRWLLLVTVVSLVASAWPAYRAMRVPTRVALAYE
jgi:putative ABC transport system permease protein